MTDIMHDFLGAGSPHWDTASTIKALHGKKRGIGAFGPNWNNAFGDPTKFFTKCIEDGFVSFIRLQFFWDYAHKLVPDSVLTPRNLKHWDDFAKAHSGIPFYLSPSCEYQSNDNQGTNREA